MINYVKFANFSFLSLFFSMIFYWIQVNFPILKRKSIGLSLMILSNILLLTFLILRWTESGHFPLSNIYEALMFLSWCFTVIHLILEKFTQNLLLSCISSPTAFFINAFATLSLPQELQKASPLVPALQSNWLMMHVTVMILSYAALISGSLLAIAFLILTAVKKDFLYSFKNQFILSDSVQTSQFKDVCTKQSLEQNLLEQSFDLVNTSLNNLHPLNVKLGSYFPTREGKEKKFAFILTSEFLKNNFSFSPSEKTSQIPTFKTQSSENLSNLLDNLSYRIIGIGFPLLTIGILSGAVWANEAWGSYWSWDPKETWALLTWLIFAIYLHTRITRGWEGKKPAFIASFGFFIVWICFLGVNLIGEGLHSYGWFQSV